MKNTSLNDRYDRAGNGRARISDAYLINLDGYRINKTIPEEKFSLIIDIDNKSKSINGISCLATFYDKSGYALAHLSSDLTGDNIELTPGRNRIQCTISGLPLKPSMYSINLALYRGVDLIDHIEQAIVIELVDNNYFGTGKMLNSDVAPLLIQHTWQIVKILNQKDFSSA